MNTLTILLHLLTLLTLAVSSPLPTSSLSSCNTSIASSSTSSSAPSSINLILHNNCPFPVYVRQAVAEHPSPQPYETCKNGEKETAEVKVQPGGKFQSVFGVVRDTCGHSVKVARTPGSKNVYQYEASWARENGRIWYNLSHNNGNPFTDVTRQIGGPFGSRCTYLRCEPRQSGSQCDDPLLGSCETVGDVIGYLC